MAPLTGFLSIDLLHLVGKKTGTLSSPSILLGFGLLPADPETQCGALHRPHRGARNPLSGPAGRPIGHSDRLMGLPIAP